MEQRNPSNYFLISLGIHVWIILLLIMNFHWTGKMPVVENSDKDMKVISAMVVNQDPLVNKVHAIQPALPKPLIQKPQPPEKKISAIPKPTVVERQPQKTVAIALEKQKKILQEKREKQLLAELQKDVKHQQQKKHQQKTLEKSLEQEMREQAEKSLQQQLQNETIKMSSARAAKVQGIVDKYKALILQAISQEWLIPSGVNKKLYCELLIRVAPGGMVLDVQVAKGSGDMALDRSARAAVFKASPLPVPKEDDAFQPFKQFVLTVKPENVTSLDQISAT